MARSCCSKSRTDRGGTASKSRRAGAGRAGARVAPRWPVHHSGRDRRGSRRGGDAGATDWPQIVGLYDVLLRGSTRRRSSRSIARRRSRCAMARRRVSRSIDASCRAASSPTIIWRTPRAPISAAGSEARPRRARPTSGRSSSPSRSRRGDFSRRGSANSPSLHRRTRAQLLEPVDDDVDLGGRGYLIRRVQGQQPEKPLAVPRSVIRALKLWGLITNRQLTAGLRRSEAWSCGHGKAVSRLPGRQNELLAIGRPKRMVAILGVGET